jgi:hypothetical protein
MASLGKKILSAFVEMTPPPPQPAAANKQGESYETPAAAGKPENDARRAMSAGRPAQKDSRFADYFDKLFREANIPGPDYYEFSRMIEAMQAIPDEASRFAAAFAGLQVQGLDKEKLLSTAAAYLQVLDTDANQFHTTVDAALQEKVHARKAAAEEKALRIQALTKEITDLQAQVHALETEIQENEEKISSRNEAYVAESADRKAWIEADIIKIKNYLH